jgi:uncharacterized membrane protein HdeD (DUF308 family)
LEFLAIVGGGSLIVHLILNRNRTPVSFWYYILPVIILITGVFILMNPEQVAANTFVIFGVVCIFFGLSLLINGLNFVGEKRIKTCGIPTETFFCVF